MVLDKAFAFWREATDVPNTANLQQQIAEIDVLLRTASTGTQRADWLLNQAVLYGILGQNEEARARFCQAVECESNDPDVRFAAEFGKAALMDQEGNNLEALEALTGVLVRYADRLQRDDAREIYLDIQQRRGINLVQLDRFVEAIPVLKECLTFELKVKARDILTFHLGYCHFGLEQYDVAETYFAASLNPDTPAFWSGQAHFFRGATLFKLGRFAEAKEELRICEQSAHEYQLAPQRIYEALAAVCRDLGETVEAENYLRLAKEVSSCAS